MSTLIDAETATLGLEGDGMVILREFGGQEFEIDVKATGLVRAGTPRSALAFITGLLNQSMRDTLILANLSPRFRGVKLPVPAVAKTEANPRVFVNKKDRDMHEKLVRRHGYK